MRTVSLAEAKAHLRELLNTVEAGEEFVITRHGRAVSPGIASRENEAASSSQTIGHFTQDGARLDRAECGHRAPIAGC
ncbi:MAG: type II toxin-antitoxin system prevent-host-death family antitoxin [Candidatus Accumulibacter sp.]|uniref:type II toxin-antitoxin system Phd/YefM family antitoxin n=1 Tax=Accumulibacter sp. TaxID=2053492 RepID=UPI00258F8ED4|nr:type II toxin-antitoxin system prevent-host-death family antitoxin [Accumulibacter sp.]MCM8623362.1 type II toxin-antitoxin system prevent-host-death family antitoxin [Accumulibacter sp.]